MISLNLMLEQIQSFLDKDNRLLLYTQSYGNGYDVQVSYLYENSCFYVTGLTNSIHVEHIRYNPNVIIEIKNQNRTLNIKGRAKILKNYPMKKNPMLELAEKDSIFPQGIFKLELIEIVPLEMQIQELNFYHLFSENKFSFFKILSEKILSSLKFWIRAVRLPFVSVSVMGVVVGTSVAFYEIGKVNSWINFILTFLGIAFFHISADLSNDYFDYHSGLDEINIQKTPFSGGSRMLQSELLAPIHVLIAAIISLSFCIGIGLYLNFTVSGNVILYIGLAGVFLGIFYVGLPFRFVYYGLGEVGIFLSFGPAVVFGSYYVQNEIFSWKPLFISILVGLLISLILFINQFPDYESDKEKGKKTWVVILGKRKSTFVYISFLALTYLLLILFVILKVLPVLSLIVLLSVPFPIKAMINVMKNYENYLAMIPASALTILTCLSYTILLSISLIVYPFV